MLRYLFTFITFMLLSASATSQNNFGVFAGINYSYFKNGFFNKADIGRTPGLQSGILYNVPLNNTVSFRPKLAFSQQGDRYVSDYKSSSYQQIGDINYKLTYLNIPLDFKFWKKIYVIAGAQAAILLSTKKQTDDYGPVNSNFDIGLNAGIGFTVNNLFFETGLYHGLTNVITFTYNDGDKIDLSNGAIKITAGYNFN